jgi:hypothetical protein
MDIGLIIGILFKILALGCVFAILFWMFNLVESKVPEPFKQIVGWLKVFVLLVCGVIAIAFILQVAGIGSDFPRITH